MTGVALADLFLSLCALAGLAVLHGTLRARGAEDPINRRFLFGVRVTILLFAGRAGLAGTGWEGLRVVVLVAAALVPLAVLILTEGLLRRHAPAWVKGVIGGATGLFLLAAFWPTATMVWALFGFQVLGLGLSGWLVVTRDRASLSLAENRAVTRLGLSLVLLIPLVAADYLAVQIGLPVQVSGLAVLVLCVLGLSLGRETATTAAVVTTLAVVAVAAAAMAGVTVALSGGTGLFWPTLAVCAAGLLVVTILTEARAAREEGTSVTLLRQIGQDWDGPVAFLTALRDHPLVDGAVLIEAGALGDLDPRVLDRVFAAGPVLRRADPRPPDGAEADHVAHLFARFDATHILRVGEAPPLYLALSMPALAASPRTELELRAVQRMAMLLGRRG